MLRNAVDRIVGLVVDEYSVRLLLLHSLQFKKKFSQNTNVCD